MPDPQSTTPESGRVAGVDYGTVRIGIAITDSRRSLASPVEVYTRSGAEADARRFRRLVSEEQVALFVVGLPVHLHGGESQKSKEARAFGAWLTQTTGVPVEYFDERFTSALADELMLEADLSRRKRRDRRDKIAAQMLLSHWLESRRRGEPPQAIDE